MKTKVALLFVCFLFIFSFAKKSGGFDEFQQNSGGIVYSNGKDAFFLELSTGKNFNLTSDTSETVVIKSPVISDNGKVLLWFQDSKFYFRRLPMGPVRAVQVNKAVYKKAGKNKRVSIGTDDIIEDIVWQGGDIKNITLSPDGSRFAFDTKFQSFGWVLYDKGNPVALEKFAAAGMLTDVNMLRNDLISSTLPIYIKKIDSFNGIFYLSTIYNKEGSHSDDPIEDNFAHPRYGNLVKRPPDLFFKAVDQSPNLKLPPNTLIKPLGHGLYGLPLNYGGEAIDGKLPKNIYTTRCTKKNAHYLTFQNFKNWEEGRKLAAFIYQIGDQWGPIEIRVLDSKKQNGTGDEFIQGRSWYHCSEEKDLPEHLQKPREWEVLVFSKSCEGLSWRPDGSLAIQSEGDLYLIDSSQLQDGFDKSKVIKKRKKNTLNIKPYDNIFPAEPKLIAKGIKGTCLTWVSDSSFLILGPDNNVYLWNQGDVKKIADSTGEFTYCSKSPFEDVKDYYRLADGYIEQNSGENFEKFPFSISGETKLKEPEYIEFHIGNIETKWSPFGQNFIYIWTGPVGSRKVPLQFALLDDCYALDDIKDPSKYTYSSSQERKEKVIDGPKYKKQSGNNQHNKNDVLTHEEVKTSKDNVIFDFSQVLLLKMGDSYAAIKPESVEEKDEKSELHRFLTYKWRFWPKVILPGILAKTDIN